MSTLILRLSGPMQSWGSSSRFTRRSTDHAPTKSGVIGLLAAARGLRRTDPLEDLLSLRFGVRIDQPGRIERDFQTARPERGKALPLTDRYYLTDAIFVAAVEGDDDLIDGLDKAISQPEFPLYLGRRSCPPAGPLSIGVRNADIWSTLTDFAQTPWQASEWYRKKASSNYLEFRFDAVAVPESERQRGHATEMIQKDEPISFDPRFRNYGTRKVIQLFQPISGGESSQAEGALLKHDPMALLGGG